MNRRKKRFKFFQPDIRKKVVEYQKTVSYVDLFWNYPYTYLAMAEPEELFKIIPLLDDPRLTFALEALEHCPYNKRAVDILVEYSKHPTIFVREGVIYGMRYHMDNPKILETINYIIENDPIPELREIAKETLEDGLEIFEKIKSEHPESYG